MLHVFCTNPRVRTSDNSLIELPSSSFSFAFTMNARCFSSMGILGISVLNLVWVGFTSSFWKAVFTGGLVPGARSVQPSPVFYEGLAGWYSCPLTTTLCLNICLALWAPYCGAAVIAPAFSCLRNEKELRLGVPTSPSLWGWCVPISHPDSYWCPYPEAMVTLPHPCSPWRTWIKVFIRHHPQGLPPPSPALHPKPRKQFVTLPFHGS